jgi:hypothetical protein
MKSFDRRAFIALSLITLVAAALSLYDLAVDHAIATLKEIKGCLRSDLFY